MTLTRKGLILAAFQCLLVLSLSGKLLYDRATCPRIWVKTAQWDPNLPIRGRYLALRLAPEKDAQWYTETNGQMVCSLFPNIRSRLRPSAAGLTHRSFGRKSRFLTRARRGRSDWRRKRRDRWSCSISNNVV